MSVHIISHTCKKRKLLRQQRKRHSKLSPGSECQCWPPSLAPNSSVTTGCTCCSLHPFPLMSHCWCDEYAGLRTHEQIKRRMLSQLIKSASRISSIVYIYIFFKKKTNFPSGSHVWCSAHSPHRSARSRFNYGEMCARLSWWPRRSHYIIPSFENWKFQRGNSVIIIFFNKKTKTKNNQTNKKLIASCRSHPAA